MNTRKNTVWWIGLIVGLFLINYIASKLHSRIDLTEEKRYSLSKPSRNLYLQLKDQVTIDILMEGKDLPAYIKKFQNSISEFLQEAREVSHNKIQFKFRNPYEGVSDTAAEKQMEDSLMYQYDLIPRLIDAPTKVGDKLEITKLIHGAVIHFRDRAIGVDFLSGIEQFGTSEEERAKLYNEVESKLEYKFANAIQKISLEERPVVAYALGHGEGWGYNINDAFLTLRKEYNSDTINLKKVPVIPKEINALVILKPTLPFTDDDKFKIDQYVMNGGKVFWMIDNMYTEIDSLHKSGGFIAFDRGLNLEDLLFNYGVRINQTLLQDMQCDFLQQQSSDGTQRIKVDWPFFPLLNGTEHPISKNIGVVRTMFPTTIDTVQVEGVKKTYLLESSDNARILDAPARIDFTFAEVAPDARLFTKKKIPAAILLEGQFKSLYDGRTSKALMDSMSAHNYPYKNSSESNKMILVADGDVAMNQFSPVAGPLPMGMNYYVPQIVYANKDFFLNSLDYLTNPQNTLELRAKEFTLRRLNTKQVEAEKTKWQLINIALPIILIIIFGVIYQQFRRYRFTAKA
jgi:ABC-2 type transport system permease protein